MPFGRAIALVAPEVVRDLPGMNVSRDMLPWKSISGVPLSRSSCRLPYGIHCCHCFRCCREHEVFGGNLPIRRTASPMSVPRIAQCPVSRHILKFGLLIALTKSSVDGTEAIANATIGMFSKLMITSFAMATSEACQRNPGSFPTSFADSFPVATIWHNRMDDEILGAHQGADDCHRHFRIVLFIPPRLRFWRPSPGIVGLQTMMPLSSISFPFGQFPFELGWRGEKMALSYLRGAHRQGTRILAPSFSSALR